MPKESNKSQAVTDMVWARLAVSTCTFPVMRSQEVLVSGVDMLEAARMPGSWLPARWC
jgi:hypothetical protein